MIGNVFDGIERPLSKLQEYSGDFLKKGCNIDAIDLEKKWHFIPSVNLGEKISRNTIVGTVKESEFFDHKIMNPNHIEAEVIYIAPEGEYTAKDTIAKIRDNEKEYNDYIFCGLKDNEPPIYLLPINPVQIENSNNTITNGYGFKNK